MEEILTANSQSYKVESDTQLTLEQKNEVILQLGGSLEELATGCPSSSITQGANKSFTCYANGTSPFIFTLKVNGIIVHTSAATTSPYTIPGGVIFNTIGTYPVILTVKDSCPGSILTGTDQCASVTVIACATPVCGFTMV